MMLVEAQPNIRRALGVDDGIAQRAMCVVTFEVPPKLASLGAISAVLLPKTP
jgi:hypothetical protein